MKSGKGLADSFQNFIASIAVFPNFARMRVISSVPAMQRLARRWKIREAQIGFVPTMGYLHAGHLSLISRARKAVGPAGLVAVSIYVNPTQFGPQEDLATYPRDIERDKQLCRDAGVDVLFAPSDAEMYPNGFSTFVCEESLSRRMEGAARPGHFRGVTTVVAKLFNIVLPDVAVFGAKDFQQAAIVQQMARDLNFPAKIIIAPTVRENDGLAMSSRNRYLTPEQRAQATVLWRAIGAARKSVRNGRVPAKTLKNRIARLVAREPEAQLDYVEFFDPKTLQAGAGVQRGTHMALAVFIGKTRLIDNARL